MSFFLSRQFDHMFMSRCKFGFCSETKGGGGRGECPRVVVQSIIFGGRRVSFQ